MSKAIGLILTITGAVLAVWFVQMMMALNWQPPLHYFLVAAMSVAMISVGLRYVFKKKPPKTPPKETPKETPTPTKDS